MAMFRVMATDGTVQDFDKEIDARTLYDAKKKVIEKEKVDEAKMKYPACSIHICHHDEMPTKPCTVFLEKFEVK